MFRPPWIVTGWWTIHCTLHIAKEWWTFLTRSITQPPVHPVVIHFVMECMIYLSQTTRNSAILTSLQNFQVPSAYSGFWTARALLVGYLVLVFNGTFSTNRLYRATGVWNISHRTGEQHKCIIKQWNNTLNWKS